MQIFGGTDFEPLIVVVSLFLLLLLLRLLHSLLLLFRLLRLGLVDGGRLDEGDEVAVL